MDVKARKKEWFEGKVSVKAVTTQEANLNKIPKGEQDRSFGNLQPHGSQTRDLTTWASYVSARDERDHRGLNLPNCEF